MKPRLLFGLTFALGASAYLLTLTDVHTYDALSYVLDVDRKPWRELFHPHHLAYGPLGALIRGAAAALGWAGSAEKLLQGANALAGALGAALFGHLAGRAAGARASEGFAPGAGAMAALLLGASYAYWYYAVEVEVYTIAAVFLVLCLGLMLAVARAPSPRLALALGAAQGGAVLFHQTNVLLGAPALLALALALRAGDGRRGTALRLLAAYALPLGLIVGGAYLGVGLGVSGFRSWGELAGWAAGYTTTGLWGGPVGAAKLGQLGQGLAASLVQPAPVGALAGLALLAVLLVCVGGLRSAPRGAVAIGLSWLLVYGGFFLWWEPDNIEFWIASLPPCYLLVVLAVHASPLPRRNRGYSALLAVAALMLAANGLGIAQRGDAELDQQRRVAAYLAEGSAPGDLIVAPDGVVELYLPFYEGRDNVTSLSQAMTATGGDWPAACALLRARIDAALAAGYEVRVALRAMEPEPAPAGQPPTPAERFGLSPEAVGACYREHTGAFTYQMPPSRAMLPGYYRLVGAGALVESSGWDFTQGSWGWQAANAREVTRELPGWALVPGVDPALTSPPLRLETWRYGTLVVTLEAATAARDAQVFFLDEAGKVDEARSVRFALRPEPGPHTYTIDLRGAPGWQGVVTGLRLDPVGVGDGSLVVIYTIRLAP